MGVAATKTFTSQLTLLYLLALRLAQVRKTLPEEEIRRLLGEVQSLPAKMSAYLDADHPIEEIAQRHYRKPFFLYLGRHIGLPGLPRGRAEAEGDLVHPHRGVLGRAR